MAKSKGYIAKDNKRLKSHAETGKPPSIEEILNRLEPFSSFGIIKKFLSLRKIRILKNNGEERIKL